MDKKQRQEMYLSYLKEEGYKSKCDEDGDISFKRQGLLYYIIIDENDENYFHIIFPRFWRIDENEEYQIALETANKINRQYKVGKILVIDGGKNVSIDVGIFLNDPKDFSIFFSRLVNMLQVMTENFAEEMKKEEFSD